MSIYKSDKGKEAILSLYERQLERLDKKFEDIYIDTTFGKTHLIETGNFTGVPLLVFHINSPRQIGIYLFLYVTTIPTTEAKKAIGASLTNKNSNPCIIVPATANSGSL